MTRAISAAFALALLAAPPAVAQCSPVAHPHQETGDLGWVNSDVSFYGGSDAQGLFRIRPGKGVETISTPDGFHVFDMRLSPGRHWLEADLQDWREGHAPVRVLRLYDTKDGHIYDVSGIRQDTGLIRFSPDETYLYWVDIAAPAPVIGLYDLRTHTTRRIALTGIASQDALPFDVTWSDGRLLFGVAAEKPGQKYFALDARTGEIVPFTGRYRPDPLTPAPDDRPTVLEGGAAAMVQDDHRLIVTRPGRAPERIAEVPPPTREIKLADGETIIPGCSDHALGIWGVIDGRYVVFNADGTLWIYGLREDRKSVLLDERGAILLW